MGGFVRKVTGAKDARAASRQQAQSAEESIQFQREALEAIRGDLQPFKDAGEGQINNLLNTIQSLPETSNLETSDSQFQALSDFSTPGAQEEFLKNDPILRYATDEATRGINSATAATGKAGSGGAAKLLQSTIMGLAQDRINNRANELTNVLDGSNALFNQKQNVSLLNNTLKNQKTNSLFNLVSMGQNSAAQTGTATQNTANAISNLNLEKGNALANRDLIKGQSTNQLFQLGLQGAMALSDKRLKHNISYLREDGGVKIYRYQYHGDDNWYEGPMAQELQAARPDLVTEAHGTYYIDYEVKHAA